MHETQRNGLLQASALDLLYTWKLGVGFKHLFIFTGYLPEEMIHHFDYIMFFKTGLKPSTKIV